MGTVAQYFCEGRNGFGDDGMGWVDYGGRRGNGGGAGGGVWLRGVVSGLEGSQGVTGKDFC